MEHIEIFLKGIVFAILMQSSLRLLRTGEELTKVIGRIMLIWVVIIGASMIKFIPAINQCQLPEHIFTMFDMLLLPTFAFVTIALTNVKSLNLVTLLLHEIPFVLIALIYSLAEIEACYTIGVAYGIVYALVVFVYSLRKISKYNAKIKEFYSDNDYRHLDWLRILYWILFCFIAVCGVCAFVCEGNYFPIAGSIVTLIFWVFFDYKFTEDRFISLQSIIDNAEEETKNIEGNNIDEEVVGLHKSVDELRQLVSPYDYDHKKLHQEQISQTEKKAENNSEKQQQTVHKTTEIEGNPGQVTSTTVISTTKNETEDKKEEQIKLPEHIEDLEIKEVSEEKLQEIMDGLEQQQIDTPKSQVSSETKDVIDLATQQSNQYPFVEELNRLCKEERIFLTPGLSIQDVVEKLGTNRTYLSNYLNKELNMTFYDFINEQRLDYAAMLLASTKINIEQIIFECGFQSKTTFHRVFANKFGCTPKQYRDRQ